MLEGVDEKVDMNGVYGIMKGVCKEEKEDKTLSILAVDVKTPDVCTWIKEKEEDTQSCDISTA